METTNGNCKQYNPVEVRKNGINGWNTSCSIQSPMIMSHSQSLFRRPTSLACCIWATCSTTSRMCWCGRHHAGKERLLGTRYRPRLHRHRGEVVERLASRGIKKSDLTREEFLEHAWEWTQEHGGIILEQLKLGASCDWERTRSPGRPPFRAC